MAPELLILDVDMPVINGPELCRTVRNDPRWSGLAVIFATARTDAATIEEVFDSGADDYVPKPIVGPELVNRVANRLERVRLYRAQAETDYLTGLANRSKADEGLAALAALSDRFSEPLAVAMLDLDGFKLVNDRHGHAVGDSVLRRLGEHLRRDFRGNDVVGRWGGEEFIVGMYGMTRRTRNGYGDAARFGEEEFQGSDGALRVSFSEVWPSTHSTAEISRGLARRGRRAVSRQGGRASPCAGGENRVRIPMYRFLNRGSPVPALRCQSRQQRRQCRRAVRRGVRQLRFELMGGAGGANEAEHPERAASMCAARSASALRSVSKRSSASAAIACSMRSIRSLTRSC